MKGTSIPDLQIAVVSRINGTSAFTDLCPNGLGDGLPQPITYPYAVFDEPTDSPDRTFGQDGWQAFFTISIVTRDGSTTPDGRGTAGYSQGMLIAREVIKAITDLSSPITMSGYNVVDVDVTALDSSRLDAVTRQVDLFFTAILEDAS